MEFHKLTSGIGYRVSGIEYQVSGIGHRASSKYLPVSHSRFYWAASLPPSFLGRAYNIPQFSAGGLGRQSAPRLFSIRFYLGFRKPLRTLISNLYLYFVQPKLRPNKVPSKNGCHGYRAHLPFGKVTYY